MIKKLFQHSLIYVIGNVINKGITILLLPLYTSVLSPGDFGKIDMITIIATLVNIVITLEINQGVARFYSEEKSDFDKSKLISTAFWFVTGTFIAFAIISICFNFQLMDFFYLDDISTKVSVLAILYIIFNGIYNFLLTQFRWQLKPKKNIIINSINSIIIIALTIFFVLVLKKGTEGVLLGLVIGNSIGMLTAFLSIKSEIMFIFEYRTLYKLLRFSSPLVLSSVGVYVALFFDRYAIRYLLSIESVGIYGVGFRIATLISFVISGFQNALTPLIYNNYSKPETKNDLGKLFRYFIFFALIFYVIVSLLAKNIVDLFIAVNYYDSYTVVPWISLSILFSQLYVFFPGLSIEQKTGTIAKINVGTALLNLTLNFIFIPLIGIIGAAIATLISAFIGALLNMYLSQKYYPINICCKDLTACLCIDIFLVSGVYSYDNLIIKIIVAIVLVIINAMLLIKRNEIALIFSLPFGMKK